MPFIVMRRTDIPAGVLQVVDLKPNTSQRSFIYDPGDGETGYINPPATNDTVVTTGAGPILTVADYCGLAAYLIDRVEDAGPGSALTAAMANATAACILTKAQAGALLDLTEVDDCLTNNGVANASGGTSLTAAPSTGTLEDVFKILQGAKYLLPGGSEVEDGGNIFNATVLGAFDPDINYRTYYYQTGALNISNGEGNLFDMKRADFEYNGVQGPAIVVYNDDGTVKV